MSAADCIFCKIVDGRLPANIVLDRDDALAFLDISPLAPGHTLLIPKQHFSVVTDAPPDVLGKAVAHLPRLVAAVQAATGTSACNVLQSNGRAAGQVVDHVHFHVIPRREDDGLGFRWNAGSYAGNEAESLAERIRAACES